VTKAGKIVVGLGDGVRGLNKAKWLDITNYGVCLSIYINAADVMK